MEAASDQSGQMPWMPGDQRPSNKGRASHMRGRLDGEGHDSIKGLRTVSATETVSLRPLRSPAASSTRGTRDRGGKDGLRPNISVVSCDR